jgi:hypothetical protein
MDQFWLEILQEISEVPIYDMRAFLIYLFESKEDSELIMSELFL